MDALIKYWTFLLPLVILQISLALIALFHVLKHQNYRFGNKIMWVLIVLFISILGPIMYFVFGRGEQE